MQNSVCVTLHALDQTSTQCLRFIFCLTTKTACGAVTAPDTAPDCRTLCRNAVAFLCAGHGAYSIIVDEGAPNECCPRVSLRIDGCIGLD